MRSLAPMRVGQRIFAPHNFERESGNVSQMRFYGGRNLAKAERDLVLATLKQCSNSRAQTAKVLGMPRSTLDKKLKQYAASGVPVPPAQNGGFRVQTSLRGR